MNPKKEIQAYTEERPWGKFERFTQNETSTVKIITVNPGQELSLQYHMKRSEFWKVISGDPVMTVGDKAIQAKEGDEFFAVPQEKHRMKGGSVEARILEISFGEFDENDIVRLEDKYGRI